MSRKNRAPKRDVLPDPLYNSQLVTRLINRVMLDGKRGTAASIVYGAFEQIKEATGNDALEVFETAMENIMPVLEVRARRVGGSKSWMQQTTLVQQLRNVKTLTVWQKPTVPSHTSVGNIMMLGTVRMQSENRKLTQYSTNTRKFIFFTQHPVPAQIG